MKEREGKEEGKEQEGKEEEGKEEEGKEEEGKEEEGKEEEGKEEGKEDEGKEDEGKEDEGKEEGQKEEGKEEHSFHFISHFSNLQILKKRLHEKGFIAVHPVVDSNDPYRCLEDITITHIMTIITLLCFAMSNYSHPTNHTHW
jgi:archaellum component FlaD/FlaE